MSYPVRKQDAPAWAQWIYEHRKEGVGVGGDRYPDTPMLALPNRVKAMLRRRAKKRMHVA